MHTKMKQTGYAGQKEGVNNVGANHNFRLKTVEQQKHHHDDAARSHRSDAHQKASHQVQ